jgi:3-oxosteroid 1-dehydrogenase
MLGDEMSTEARYDVIVVGSGIGGMAAAVRAHELGAAVALVEKASYLGGATAWSGGQVWVGANHVAEREGHHDSIADTLTYVEAIAASHPELFDSAMAHEWVEGAIEAARWFEDVGAIAWRLIPGYEDYYYPDAPGSRPTGRYLTGQPFDGSTLGDQRKLILDAPHWPIGITYEEMFAWGGVSARDRWDTELMAQRRRDDIVTFGQGIASWFAKAVLDRDIAVYTGQPVTELVVDDDRVVGIRSDGGTDPDAGVLELTGSVILATGAHDWSRALTDTYIGVPADDGGSLTPPSIGGDGIGLGTAVGAGTGSVPGTAAPITPGYLLPDPQFEGDSGFRGCYEHCMPHTILVNGAGERFCDDSFHPAVIAGVMHEDETGARPNLPFFMIWGSPALANRMSMGSCRQHRTSQRWPKPSGSIRPAWSTPSRRSMPRPSTVKTPRSDAGRMRQFALSGAMATISPTPTSAPSPTRRFMECGCVYSTPESLLAD